jgi:phosphatidylglycerol:prolipoprotein diacylglycerol transferase
MTSLNLMTINIGLDPEIHKFGGLLLTWHGVFTAIGIAAGVYLVVLLGKRQGFLEDDIYTAALLAIPCGIIGARALFVAERWGDPGVETVADIFRINEGGIAIYGAVLGGIVGGGLYCWFRKLPLRRAADVAACGGLLGMAIGRVGDLINGEHFSKVSSLPWAVRYTNLNSPSVVSDQSACHLDPNFVSVDTSKLCAQHPAVGYEMLGDLLILGLVLFVIWYIRRDGVGFFSFLLLYSLMRLGVSELRIDSETVIWGLSTPQVTALLLIPPSVLGLIYSWFRGGREEAERPPPSLTTAPAPAS